MYLQIKNAFKKLSCFKPFLPWHELQEPQLPPTPEELYLPACSDTFNRKETYQILLLPRLYMLWELYMKQHLLQRVIHMLFLWPNSGNGIPQACFQKHSCAFPKKTPHSSTELIMQCCTLCQLASLS